MVWFLFNGFFCDRPYQMVEVLLEFCQPLRSTFQQRDTAAKYRDTTGKRRVKGSKTPNKLGFAVSPILKFSSASPMAP
jgi:hypothetical protein